MDAIEFQTHFVHYPRACTFYLWCYAPVISAENATADNFLGTEITMYAFEPELDLMKVTSGPHCGQYTECCLTCRGGVAL